MIWITQSDELTSIVKVHEDLINNLEVAGGNKILTGSLDGTLAIYIPGSHEVQTVINVDVPIRCLSVNERRNEIAILSGTNVLTFITVKNDFSVLYFWPKIFEIRAVYSLPTQQIVTIKSIDDKMYFTDHLNTLNSYSLSTDEGYLKAKGSNNHLDWITQIIDFNASQLLTVSEDRTCRVVDKESRKIIFI